MIILTYSQTLYTRQYSQTNHMTPLTHLLTYSQTSPHSHQLCVHATQGSSTHTHTHTRTRTRTRTHPHLLQIPGIPQVFSHLLKTIPHSRQRCPSYPRVIHTNSTRILTDSQTTHQPIPNNSTQIPTTWYTSYTKSHTLSTHVP
jgi:hypothetical protein